ncbi:MAG: NAD(+)/NADH kinase [Dehalococcoidia bacterium]|nr:NAD(+)/NADH kinase [Dehalococcoidia bacterium]
MGGPIGILANPASGKDIRRLVANASVFDNREKRSIVRRVVLGAIAAGAREFVYMPDSHGIAASALEELEAEAAVRELEIPRTGSALDTSRAAERMREAGVSVAITLGGDGTSRAFALGWPSAPLIAISTGTNNVFPKMIEGTVAGAAAGLVASGAIAIHEVARQAKMVHVTFEDGREDLALIDVALLDGPFVGARAIWDAGSLRALVLARAEPAAIGMSSIGGLLRPVGSDADEGLVVEVGGTGPSLLAPITPGQHSKVPIAGHHRLALGEPYELHGPGILAFDGEREHRLMAGQRAVLTVRRNGPLVIDVPRTLQLAACRGIFRTDGDAHGD